MATAIDGTIPPSLIQNYNYPLPTGGMPSEPRLVSDDNQLLVGIGDGEPGSRPALLDQQGALVGTSLDEEDLLEPPDAIHTGLNTPLAVTSDSFGELVDDPGFSVDADPLTYDGINGGDDSGSLLDTRV